MEKKITILAFLLLTNVFCFAQNTLMVSPQTGTMIQTGTINNFKLISDGTSVALVAANNATGRVFIVDINDRNAADATANTISVSSANVKTRISAAIGQTVTSISNIEVNPISKAVYVMAMVNATPFFLKLTNAGNTITALNFNTMPYCSLNFTNANCTFQDITFGGGRLFVSSNHNTLNGELGFLAAPFTHNTTITKRATTMFKSNWGDNYFTMAPLEKLNFITIDGVQYLSGVTTCAPGFSETVTSLTGNTGLFTVRESFDMVFSASVKNVAMPNGTEAYLLNLHSSFTGGNEIYRIGKRFLNGSTITNNTFNDNSVKLREPNGSTNPALPTADILKYPGTFASIAYYNPCQLLTLSQDEQTLSKLDVCTPALDIAENEIDNSIIKLYPNPTTDLLNLDYNDNLYEKIEASIYSIDGKLLKIQTIDSSNKTISTSSLQAGNYILNLSYNGKRLSSKSFMKI